MNDLRQVAGCKNGNCPKVFVQGDRAFVQGMTSADAAAFVTPAGELVVELPLDVLLEAAREVGAK